MLIQLIHVMRNHIIAVIQINQYFGGELSLSKRLIICVTMYAYVRRHRKFGLRLMGRQIHGIVTRFSDFGAVAKIASVVVGIEGWHDGPRSANGHHQHITKIAYAGTTQMRMRKSINKTIVVMISATTIPTVIDAGIGAQLNHAKGRCRTGESVSMSARAHKWIDVF